MIRRWMSYGTLPPRAEFDAASESEVPGGKYRISLSNGDAKACEGFELGDGEWPSEKLWDAISQVVSCAGDEITVAVDEHIEDVYLIVYPFVHRAPVEIDPDESE